MADPLSLLREFVSSGKIDEVVLSGDRVDFGGKFTFSKNVATGYKSQQGKGNFYDLETVLFFAKHVDVKFAEYFKKASKEFGAGKQVTFVDRKDLQEYLTGRSDRSEFINLTVPDLEVERPAKRTRLEEGGEAGPGSAAPMDAEGEEAEGAEDAALRKIRENEVQLRDRNSMLSVPGRSFRKVLTILAQAQREQQRAVKAQRSAAPKPAIPVRPSGRYERQTQQDATLKQMGAAELGVQVGFKPTAAAAAAPSAREQQGAAPPPPPPAVASTSRHGQQQQQQRSSSRSQQQQKQQQQQARHSGQGGPAKPPPRHGTPVIMVPPGMTALLNMHNIRSFLEGGEFQTTEQAKAVAAAIAAEKAKKEVEAGKRDPEAPPDPVVKEDRIAIQRTIGRKQPVKYYITDKEPAHKQDWERVVAVVCLGKAWQFKKWPFKNADKGDLVETFSKVMGVFVHYTDEQVDATVKSWNVKILGLNRQSRHRDATMAQEFWRMLDTHLQARGSTLAY